MKPAGSPAHDGWLKLAEHARKIGVPERTLRRRLAALHQQRGGGVLRSHNKPGTKVRKWWFNPIALQAGLENDPDETQAALGEHTLALEDLREKVNALRQAVNSLKRQVKQPKAPPGP